jgi:hypothetical protein
MREWAAGGWTLESVQDTRVRSQTGTRGDG